MEKWVTSMEVRGETLLAHAKDLESANQVLDILRAEDINVRDMRVHRRSLEDLFTEEAKEAGRLP